MPNIAALIRDNKDIFISTVLIVEAIRYFLSAVRTFL